jgi:hypothetical protein
MHEKASQVYKLYQDLSNKNTKRGIARIILADPRLSGNYVTLCCHNWGNAESKKVMEYMNKVSSYLYGRMNREYDKALHQDHIAENKVGYYLWCKECQKVEAKIK